METLVCLNFDQIFVHDLLMLSMSPRLSGYQYEVRLFVCVDAVRPSQQFFKRVGRFPVFLGLNLY